MEGFDFPILFPKALNAEDTFRLLYTECVEPSFIAFHLLSSNRNNSMVFRVAAKSLQLTPIYVVGVPSSGSLHHLVRPKEKHFVCCKDE